ncbi:MAG: PIN domain-containing protein [Gemmatimonadetes bacterium]|nr:PIN domain-containing protein [Gemmatimonadota bacterium]
MAVFLDTNILVYPYDRREPARGRRAMEILQALAASGGATVSTQVLGEFFWVITRRLPDPLSPAAGAASVERHARTWRVLDITLPVVREALRGVQQHAFSYWDALIWATARLGQIAVVLSEDFTDGTDIEGVVFRNPFRPGFELASV